MPTDFRDAAERHWSDAEHLLADKRLANADHLYGLSAECSLKAVMLALGMSLDTKGIPTDKKFKVHIEKLWNEFVTFAQTKKGSRYAAMVGNAPNPFGSWSVEQRYDRRSDFTEPVVEAHRKAALLTKTVLDAAITSGDVK